MERRRGGGERRDVQGGRCAEMLSKRSELFDSAAHCAWEKWGKLGDMKCIGKDRQVLAAASRLS